MSGSPLIIIIIAAIRKKTTAQNKEHEKIDLETPCNLPHIIDSSCYYFIGGILPAKKSSQLLSIHF